EIHVTGSNFNGRVNWIGGLFYLDELTKGRTYRWSMLDFPRSTTNPNALHPDVAAYLESWWNAAGNPVLQGGSITANPPASSDTLSYSESEQKALFGEVTIGVTDKLDVTLGVRVTDDAGRQLRLAPTSGFRPPLPGG